jgi:hypothetical protein
MTFLVQVELREGNRSYIRHVLQDAPVGLEDLVFYYTQILGLTMYEISTQSYEVPATFTLGLLGAGSHKEIPSFYPAYDIMLETDEAREKYAALLGRICEMEKMRAECGLGSVGSSAPEAASTATANPKPQSKYKSWVDSILAAIRMDAGSDLADTEPDLTPIADNQTIAWVLTPVLDRMRETYGNRIITDTDIGRKWGPLLGTEMYPDIAVCRRLSTVKWRANNSRSAALARAAIEWYIEAQVLETTANTGISPWIQNADKELAAVLVPFQNLGARQAFVAASGPANTGETTAALHPVMTILHRLEEDHLRSALTHEGVVVVDLPVWERYVRHILRTAAIGTDVIDNVWGAVREVLGMWVRGNQGVDPLGYPVYPQWQTLWSLLLADVAADPVKVRERFGLFVETLDAYDPILAHTMSNSARYELVNKWIAVFVEKEMVVDPKGRVVATLLYTQIRNWILNYLPITVGDNPLKPMNIGPTLTTMGYLCHKLKKGRMILNLRYRVPPENPLAQVLEPGAPVASNVLDIMREEAAKEASDFVISAKREIHLGKV